MNTVYVISIALISLVCVWGEDVYDPSSSLNKFSLNLLAEISDPSLNNSNVILSPYSIWSAMSIINEGAGGNTTKELSKILGIPSNNAARQEFRKTQQHLIKDITRKRDGGILHVANAIFTNSEAKLNPDFQELVRTIYSVDVEPLNFKNRSYAAQYINNKISTATEGRLKEVINPGDIQDIQMYVASAFYFKGVWQQKFHKLSTRKLPFYDQHKEVIANVSTMENIGLCICGSVLDKSAEAIELPYLGNISMLIILPNENISLSTVMHNLAKTTFAQITKDLKVNKGTPTDVRIQLPKLNVTSDSKLNSILYDMGIRDAFSEEFADLRGVSNKSLYVSRVTHKADLEVDEYGTEGSATTTIELEDKDGSIPIMPPTPFLVNRPFAFIIYDKESSSILLAGIIRNPSES